MNELLSGPTDNGWIIVARILLVILALFQAFGFVMVGVDLFDKKLTMKEKAQSTLIVCLWPLYLFSYILRYASDWAVVVLKFLRELVKQFYEDAKSGFTLETEEE